MPEHPTPPPQRGEDDPVPASENVSVPKPVERAKDEQVAPLPGPEVEKAAPQLFLSHASEDGEAVKALATKLRRAGLNVWLDIDELKPGDNWMAALETALAESDAFAVYIGRVGVERWITREVRVALDRSVKDPKFLVVPILGPGANPESIPTFLAQHQWLDLRTEDSDPTRIKELLGAILDRPAEVVSLLAPGEIPFRGLLAFDVRHEHLFFGRERETEELLQKLRLAPFLAVIGESGSGKSSLVRAGLVAALNRGRFGDSDAGSWRTIMMRPGKDPFRELSNAMHDLVPEADPAERIRIREACARQLAEGTDGLGGCVGALVPAGQRTLLVIDQFEELFTQSTDAGERDRFIDTVLAGSDASGDRPVHTVVTLRADFFSECFAHPRLPEIIAGNQYPVRAIARDQLVEVIEKPAAMAGVQLEPGLVDAILHDLGDESASLALLEHTLLELWKLRSGDILTHEAYKSIGRVQGALEHHAEDVFAALNPAQQKSAKRVMLNLAMPGKGRTVTRRQVAYEDLVPAGEAGKPAERVLQHLIEQRLLTVRQAGEEGEEGSTEEVEVAHEALLRGWARFRGWLDEDREFLLWRQRTRTTYDAWEESGRDQGALLRGGPLAEAQRWFEQRSEDLGEAGREFIAESVARARRALWIKRAAVATIAALAVAAGIFAVFAQTQKREAENNFEVATLALQQVGAMTEQTGQAKAEQPEAVELKRGIAERAIAFYENVGTRSSFSADLQLEEAVALYRLGNILTIQRQEGASEAAIEAYDKAVRKLEELTQRDPGNTRYRQELANAHYWRAEGRQKSGDPAAAETDYDQALAAQRQLVDAASGEAPHLLLFELGRTQNGRGITLRHQKRWTEAEASYNEARNSFERAIQVLGSPAAGDSLSRYRQGLAWALTNLAELYEGWGNEHLARREDGQAQDKFLVAADRYRAAIAILQELAHSGRALKLELAVNYNNLGNVLTRLDRWDDANAANQTAVELMEALAAPLPDISNELGNTYLSRGAVTWGLELDDEARQIYRKAREIYDSLALDLEGEALPQYRWRRALALAGLADLGDRNAEQELCRLLPELSDNQREAFDGLCS